MVVAAFFHREFFPPRNRVGPRRVQAFPRVRAPGSYRTAAR